ncbi:MAG: hypothetical protein BKP49_02875 [Treponema sp. CETP13]|nr:MAG: hypothetical protein BKP49_02875 [Treponema sp. CETP13]
MKNTIKTFTIKNSVVFILFLLLVILAFVDSSLVSVRNFRNIISIGASYLIVATAFAFCMYIGYLDFSLAFTAGTAGILTASFFQTTESTYLLYSSAPVIPVPVVIFLVCILMCLVGVVLMILIQKFSFPFYFANLGVIVLLYGIVHVFLHNSEIGEVYLDGLSESFRNLSTSAIGNDPTYSLPVSVIISILICMGAWFAMRKVPLIQKIVHKSKVTHYNVQKSGFTSVEILLIFCSTGVIASFGGIMRVAYVDFVDASFGINFLFDILAICLISGFSFFGGKGTLPMLILGTLIYTACCYAIDFVGFGRFTSYIIRAFIIIWSIGIDIYLRQKKSKNESTISEVGILKNEK